MASVNQESQRESLARLRWQCRRGMLELDLMLQPFVENNYVNLSSDEQAVFRKLLKYPDQELQEILLGFKEPDNKEVVNVTNKIRQSISV